MNINYLYVKNWKCFDSTNFHFSQHNIINSENGTGKTSQFQAIIYGLYGKRPLGLNLNALRLDPENDCVVRVDFDYTGPDSILHNVKIQRQFGHTNTVLLKEDEEIIASNATDAFAYIDNIIPWNIISVLWAPSTLTSSEILSPDFLINCLFSFVFKDPKEIEKAYKNISFQQRKVVKNFESLLNGSNEKEILQNIENTKAEIFKIKSNIKSRVSNNDNEISKAKISQEAASKLASIKIKELVPEPICSLWLSATSGKTKVEAQEKLSKILANEEAKCDDILTKLSKSSLKQIKSLNEQEDECIVCGRTLTQKLTKRLTKAIESEIIDLDLIARIKSKLEVLCYEEDDVKGSIAYRKLTNEVANCPNWESVILNYDSKNNELWDTLDEKEKTLKALDKEKSDFDGYGKAKAELSETQKRLLIVQEYLKEAVVYYSNSVTSKASSILCDINSRYDQIFLDEGSYFISLTSINGEITLLPVTQLSSGEKTLIGVSLILAARELFFATTPLLFDESFGALDKENVEALKNMFKKTENQYFIITHDSKWIED